ncbi:glycoside hydrolase family 73 protein [Rugamonas sp.]|uniref:glycoside hydrolase family 73 protein n=1 Tax=Rugamonas sp. TaxID=1926287 RepID=UPI0025EFCB16|nr:glucosaminidase domain-containing protein [Rugamonas sp.]
MSPAAFIAMIGSAARASAALTKIPASFTIAQAALESGWGTARTALMAHNLFNIKADPAWHGPTYQMASTEHIGGKDVLQVANWRMYPDFQACIDDHAKFFSVNPRYAACWKESTGEGWTHAVAAAGYATDPDYAVKVIATMHSHDLHQFDQP